jgi:ABC-type phosphate transport system substrate-binding protein
VKTGKAFTTGIRLTVLITMVVLMNGCKNKHLPVNVETSSSGTIDISVDETFKPVIDAEIKVFEASYPHAKIIAHYKPEADCLKDIVNNPATRLVIVSRGLSDAEERFFMDTLQYVPISDIVAYDAVAIVVNSHSADSLLTVKKIKGILDGSSGDKETAVFDGFNATSTVRYAQDSILQGKPLNLNKVMAVNNSRAVIDYVANHNNVLGFVGVSWIGNPGEETDTAKKIKISAIACPVCGSDIFVRPYQANITYLRYPFVRGIYYILKENYNGLGSGFTSFLGLERGQLIFRRASLAPAKIDFSVRNVSL